MKYILLIIFCLLSFGNTYAQEEELTKEEKERRERNIQAGNPFAEFGYKAKVATLSKGKYLEVHDLDSIVKIGSFYWHVKKQKIVGNIEQDTTDIYRQPLFETAGRWLSPDPLAEEFPEWSPYNFTMSNPIFYNDPGGKAPVKALCCGAEYRFKQMMLSKGGVQAEAEKRASQMQAEIGKQIVRYGTPIEDLYGVATGQDFDGNEYNRVEAGGWAAASFIPFAKLGKGFKVLKSFKYSDEVGSLVKSTGKFGDEGKEIFTFTKSGSFKDAKTVTKDIIGDLGDDAIEYIGRKGPFKNKANGMMSADGKRGYRIDVDKNSGEAHINWWTHDTKGSVPFSGGQRQAKSIVNNKVFE